MLTVQQASERIRAAVQQLPWELVAIDEAMHRFLATDIEATRPLPPCDNSAMDGFAVRADDVPGELPVLGTIAAGHLPDAILRPGHAWRIMTGAPMPRGADAVVIREHVDDMTARARFDRSATRGQNIRNAGEDIAIGARVAARGTHLGPGEIGLLAALGNATVRVHRRPRVAIISTGDELVGVDTVPGPGQIVNSNAYALAAQVRDAGGVPIVAGIAPDLPDVMAAMFRRGLDADVLLTSGGVSVGDFDHVKSVFATLGVSMDFWKVAMKPGKPLAFGVSEAGKLVFGLPGNPVSSMVVFELFARPALLAMQGATSIDRPRAFVSLATTYDKQPGRAHFVRARLHRKRPLSEDAETLVATPLAKQGSGMLSSMVGVDALLHIPANSAGAAAGERVSAILLRPV